MMKSALRSVSVAAIAAAALAAPSLAADPIIFDNGPFITSVGNGPGGSDLSTTQSPAAPVLSFSAIHTGSVADDFVISGAPAGGVKLKHMHFYSVQQSVPHTNPQYTKFYVSIYSDNPSTGGTLIHGDLTTDRLISSTWTGAYRQSSAGTPNTSRPITRLDVDLSWLPPLVDGTYWIQVSAVADTTISPTANAMAIFVTPRAANAQGYQLWQGTWHSTFDYPFTLFGYCKADFSQNGNADIDDIFIFLNAWFAADPRTDQNGDGVSIDDIFIFLNTWFAGCP